MPAVGLTSTATMASPRAHAGADRRVALDRLDQDRAALGVLTDVDADAAEIAALEFLVERADRVWRSDRSYTDRRGRRASRRRATSVTSALLANVRVALRRPGRRCARSAPVVLRAPVAWPAVSGPLPAVAGRLEAVGDQAVQGACFAVDQALRVDRFVVAVQRPARRPSRSRAGRDRRARRRRSRSMSAIGRSVTIDASAAAWAAYSRARKRGERYDHGGEKQADTGRHQVPVGNVGLLGNRFLCARRSSFPSQHRPRSEGPLT